MEDTRRSVLKKLGATAASLGTVAVAGCLGGDGGDEFDRPVEEDLPEDRRIDREIVQLSVLEEYSPQRYRTHEITTQEVSDVLGVDNVMDPEDITAARTEEGDYDMFTSAWYSAIGGDPDNVVNFRYTSDGLDNDQGQDDPDYDELARASNSTYDLDERQEYVNEAQEYIMEQAWEAQFLDPVRINAYNTNVIDPDSIEVDGRLLGSWWTWTNLEPGPENDDGTVITNNWDATNVINPFDPEGMGPARNMTPTYLMQDTLIRYEYDGEEYQQVNWIADDIEILDDEVTIVVEISDEFEFHDGEPLTAEDVVWTFDTIIEEEAPGHTSSVIDHLESVELTGDNEVTFTLFEPYAPFTRLTFWRTPIVPSHYWEELIEENPDTPLSQISFDDDQPLIGSGPFEYGSWSQGEEFIFEANDDHPIAPPEIDRRITRPLSSSTAEMEALEQGEYGYMDFWFGSNQRMLDTVEENDDLGYETQNDDCRECNWINIGNPEMNPPLSDVSFRQAYTTMVDHLSPVIIEEAYDGVGDEIHTPITPLFPSWHNPDVEAYEGGPQAAIDILADAGYVWDEDGNLYAPEGQEELAGPAAWE